MASTLNLGCQVKMDGNEAITSYYGNASFLKFINVLTCKIYKHTYNCVYIKSYVATGSDDQRIIDFYRPALLRRSETPAQKDHRCCRMTPEWTKKKKKKKKNSDVHVSYFNTHI